MDNIEKTYRSMFDNKEQEPTANQDLSTNELDVTDPIDEIIKEVGEKYKKTWKELAK